MRIGGDAVVEGAPPFEVWREVPRGNFPAFGSQSPRGRSGFALLSALSHSIGYVWMDVDMDHPPLSSQYYQESKSEQF